MSTRITAQVVNGQRRHVIVPVRFARASTGEASTLAPDPDDRGHQMPLPDLWVPTDARGFSFGITVGETVRIRVERVDIDPSAPLAVRIRKGSPHQIELVRPAGGGLLPADGIIEVRGIVDRATQGTKGSVIEARLGSLEGPVLAEAEPHTFTPLTLNVATHVYTLHPEATAPGSGRKPTIGGGPLDIDRLFGMVNAIYLPAGVRVRVAKRLEHEIFDFNREETAFLVSRGRKGNENDVMTHSVIPNHCNVHFVRFMDGSGGLAVRRDQLGIEGVQQPGVLAAVEGMHLASSNQVIRLFQRPDAKLRQIAELLGHEMGHFLELAHAGDVSSPGRVDSFARRQIMHPFPPGRFDPTRPSTRPRLQDIGYGSEDCELDPGVVEHVQMAGHLLTLKKHPFYKEDGEVERMRKRMRKPNGVLY